MGNSNSNVLPLQAEAEPVVSPHEYASRRVREEARRVRAGGLARKPSKGEACDRSGMNVHSAVAAATSELIQTGLSGVKIIPVARSLELVAHNGIAPPPQIAPQPIAP